MDMAVKSDPACCIDFIRPEPPPLNLEAIFELNADLSRLGMTQITLPGNKSTWTAACTGMSNTLST